MPPCAARPARGNGISHESRAHWASENILVLHEWGIFCLKCPYRAGRVIINAYYSTPKILQRCYFYQKDFITCVFQNILDFIHRNTLKNHHL